MGKACGDSVSSVPTLSVAGTELFYERRGAGEPLLLIQGLGANATHWGEAFLAALERDAELILLDNRGAGRSAPLRGVTVTTATLAADAIALLDALELDSVHVLGISMGGMVAQELALAAPGRVRSLTLGCTSCGGTQSRMTDREVAQRLMAAALSGDRGRLLRAGFELVVSAQYAAAPGNYAAFVAAAQRQPADIPLLMAQKAAVEGHDAYGRLSGLDVAALVIHGTADKLLHWINGDLVASLVPGARLELLEGIGHLFFWERAEQSAQLVRDHVAAHSGR